MSKTIIFDFDGTLADTLNEGVAIYNRIAHEYGCTPVALEKVPELRAKKPQEFLKDYGLTFLKLPRVLLRLRSEINSKMRTIQAIPGVIEEIMKISAAGYPLAILTSNSHDNVKSFLQRNHIDKLFTVIFSEKHLFGKHKAMKRLMKKNNLTENEVIYIGDETRDVEAAHKAGIPVIAVSWGFNTKEIIEHVKPEVLIHKPSELLPAIQKLS